MRLLPVVIAVVLAISLPASAQIDDKVADRLWESSKVLDELVKAPDGGIPKELLKRAECVAVIPGVLRAAFGFGGRYGRGAVSCKKNAGTGPWGPPSMIGLSGGSFGIQLGGTSTDVVMLFMTPDSIKHLLREKVTLGGDASAAAGPKGRAAAAETSATMRAEILTYARSRGLFAGISLNGAVLTPDKDANKALYNRQIEANELLVNGNVTIPAPAQKFVDMLTTTSAGS
jgi:lipid-binding SYLF domain-containing protein